MVVVLIALVGGTVLYLRARDSTTAITVDDAVASFGDSQIGRPSDSHRPTPGVYVYDTVGDERIDALGGPTHAYPAQTTMTVTYTDCGYRVRWDVFQERFDELDLCITPEGESVDTTRQYREFFGITNDRTYQCDAAALVRVEPAVFGETRTTPCTSPASDAEIRVTVVGLEKIQVGNESVDALHILLETTLSGDVRGTSSLNYWTDPQNGLIFRRESTVTSDADSPVGVTRYDENYTVQLVSRRTAALTLSWSAAGRDLFVGALRNRPLHRLVADTLGEVRDDARRPARGGSRRPSRAIVSARTPASTASGAPLDPPQLVGGRHVEGTLEQRSGLVARRPTDAPHRGPTPALACASCHPAASAASATDRAARSLDRGRRARVGPAHCDLGVGRKQEDPSRWTRSFGRTVPRLASVPPYLPRSSPARSWPRRGVRDRGQQLRARRQACIRSRDRRERVEGALVVTELLEHQAETHRRPREPQSVRRDVRRFETPPAAESSAAP